MTLPISLLPYKVTISRPTYTTSGGEQTRTFAAVYTSIPCRYYPSRGTLNNTETAQQTQENNINMILEPSRTDVVIWDRLEIDGVNAKYIVTDVKQQKLYSTNNHVFILAKQE